MGRGSVLIDQSHRTLIEVYYDLLTAAREPIDAYELRITCTMKWKTFQKFTERLIQENLLAKAGGLYLTTQKGLLLRSYLVDVFEFFHPTEEAEEVVREWVLRG